MLLSQTRRGEVIDLCRRLVSIPSPSGEEEEAVRFVRDTMEALGYDEVVMDRLGNVWGCIRGSRPGRRILFDSHMDTVGVADQARWTRDPYCAEISSGRIYGRGSSDMKGAAAAMIMAAAYLAEDHGREFSGEIYVSCTVHEECFEGVAAREVSRAVKPDWVIIGEASNLNINRGQRGRAEIQVETFGTSAHSSSPEVGHNAVYDMFTLARELRGIQPADHAFLGSGIMELTDIISHPHPGASVVPEHCTVTYDRRLLPGETEESVLAGVNGAMDRVKEGVANLNARARCREDSARCWTGEILSAKRFFPAWVTDEDHELVGLARKALSGIGLCPEVSRYSFCTNGSHYAGEAGIPTIGFGPSPETLAHVVDEYIEVEQLVLACAGYYGIMEAASRGLSFG